MKNLRLHNWIILVIFTVSLNTYAQNKNDKNNKIITLSAKSYEKETSNGIVLVDYWAVWCGPCKKMEPILKEIADETNVKVAKLNVDDYKTFVSMQKVQNIPTMILYKDGIEVERLTGIYTKEELMKIIEIYIKKQ